MRMGDHEYAVGEMVLIKGYIESVIINEHGASYFVKTPRNTLKVYEDEIRPDTELNHDRER